MKQLSLNRYQIIRKTILKTYIWIFLPISIFGGFESCSTYIEAGTHLTPYSVSVSGYHRKDGTHVQAHNRRPPGSVKRDAPWERKRFFMGTLFLGSIALGIVALFTTYKVFKAKIGEKKYRISIIVKNREALHKNIFGKNLCQSISDKIDFNILPKYPQYLLHDDLKDCLYKHKDLPKSHFYVKYLAVKYYYRVCLEHVTSLPSIGRGQPRSKYFNEIAYYERYKELFHSFSTEFKSRTNGHSYQFSENEIEEYFYYIYKKCNHLKFKI